VGSYGRAIVLLKQNNAITVLTLEIRTYS